MKIKAAVLFQYNQPLQIREDIEVEHPRENEVLIKVKATGLCHSDLNVFLGLTPVEPPVIAGHEILGEVIKVGNNVTRVREGDLVVVSFIQPCGKCKNCISGYENLCEVFIRNRLKGVMLDGTSRVKFVDGKPVRVFMGGGFAEFVVVHENAVNKVPESLKNYGEGLAILGCAGLTAYGAVMNVGEVKAGESAVVIGAGGVGLSIVQMLSAIGAGDIIVVDIYDWKLKKALELGATYVMNSRNEDVVARVREITDGGADVVFEAAGTLETIRLAMEMIRVGGRVVQVGIPPANQDIPIKVAYLLRNGIRVLTSHGGRPRLDIPKLFSMVKNKRYDPNKLISNKYKLEEINSAIESLKRGESLRNLILPSS